MASSSSTSQMMETYDVFINFRGSDVRDNFLSHLLKALADENVDTFVDEEINRGDKISSALLEIIERSYISVPIFSENYADSEWCLDELAKIVECKKTMGQIVIPVFYGVDPTDVQELSGSFGDALAKHRQQLAQHSLYKVESWSQALMETAGLSGLVSQNIKPDSKLIEEIVKDILGKLNQVPPNVYCNDGLFGIVDRVQDVESLLYLDSQEVRAVGIWGVGGIGKTTIANKIFDKFKGQFTSRCFVANVRQNLENACLDCLQNKILGTLLGTKISDVDNCFISSSFFRRRIARRKVLIVLDDVSDSEQIELLIGKYDIYGPGSRIIITSRDKHVLRYGRAEIYEVEALNNHEALSLFCLHAFREEKPKKEYKALVDRAVEYAQGIPLALKVLSSNLYNRSAEEWEDELEKLKDTSDEKIGKILRISYDGLCKFLKEIFLDIACLFNGEDKDRVERILDRPGSRIGISRLCEKSLISISMNKLYVHDLLQQMARDITREEKQLGNRRILWHHKDICDLLTKDEGSGAIKGISLDMSKIKDIQLKPTAFERMYNLRYLMFRNSRSENTIKIRLPRGLTLLPTELRLLHWEGYPLNSLSSNSFLEDLVELRMPDSQLKELWNAQLALQKLKLIDLRDCVKLIQLPDFSTTPNLEILILDNCENLQSLPQNLGNLEFLQILDLSFTAVENLPESICSLKHLKKLNVLCCKRIHSLPDNLGNLVDLEVFCATMTGINHVPSSFSQLQKLSRLGFGCCEGFIFSPEFVFPCLTMVNIEGCRMLEFPISLCSLTSLEILYVNGNYFKSIPEEIIQLSNLVDLDLSANMSLENLPELPSQRLRYLYLRDCTSLESAFGSIQLLQKQQKLIRLGLSNCLNLDREEYNQIIEHVFAIAEKDELEEKLILCIPGSEVVQQIEFQNKRGSFLTLSFSAESQLENLDLDFYFCAVFEPKLPPQWPHIYCNVIFTDESGQRYYARTCCSDDNRGESPRFISGRVPVAHMFLYRDKLKFLQREFNKLGEHRQNEYKIADRCTIHFHFFHTEYDDDILKDDIELDDFMIKTCGVHPAFAYPKLTSMEQDEYQRNENEDEDVHYVANDDDQKQEEEEERPFEKSKHSGRREFYKASEDEDEDQEEEEEDEDVYYDANDEDEDEDEDVYYDANDDDQKQEEPPLKKLKHSDG